MYKLLILDDEPLVQAGIRSMLHWDDIDVTICGVASNGQLGWELMQQEHPDIILTDIKMPVMSGLDLLKKTREEYPDYHYPAFIILTSYEDFQLAKEAITYHATDYLVKIELTPDALKDSILRAIESIRSYTKPQEAKPALSSTDLQALREKFFIRLLHNLYDSSEQFDLLRQDLDIPFSYVAYQCCYFEMHNPAIDNMTLEKQLTLYASSYQMLQEIAGKYVNAYFVTLDRKHGVIIVLYHTEPTDKELSFLSECLQQVSASLTNYYQTSLKCGIGSLVHAPLSISDSYQAARQAFRTLPDATGIANIADVTADRHSTFNLSVVKDDLGRAFSEYDEEVLDHVIEQICTLFTEHPTHYVQALDAACNVLFLSISLMPNGEEVVSSLYTDYSDGYRSIYRQQSTEQVIIWLREFRDRLCQSFADHKKEHRHHIVDNVKKYIEMHVTQKLNLNEVASVYGISPNYLSALFRKYNYCGYSEYVTERKIAEAKRMMQDENKKIYEIADALGFESAFYFSKVFKKVEGVSPSDYLNRG